MLILWILLGIVVYVLSFILCYKEGLECCSDEKINNVDRTISFIVSLIPFLNIVLGIMFCISNYVGKRKYKKSMFKFLSFLEPKE